MEGEVSKVRLVRCPKCEKVLPELPDFSLYKCGGCGAVLRANKQGSRSDDLFEKSDDEKGEGASEKEKQICDKMISLIDSSSSKAEDKVFVKAIDQSNRAETMNLHHRQGNQEEDGVSFDGRYNTYLRGQFYNRVHKNGHVENAKREFSTFSHPREGSSNYGSNFPHDFGEHKRIENLEHDRAELLRKIDELKIQQGSSSDARGKPKDISPINRKMDRHLYIHNPYVPEGPCRENLQPFTTGQNVLDPVYGDCKHGHASNMGNIYPPNRVVRSSYEQPYHDQFSGYNIGLNQNKFLGFNMGLNQKIPAPQNSVGSVNGPQCLCYRCYRNWQVQSRVQQTTVESTQHNTSSGYGLHGHNLGSSSDIDFNNGILNGGLVRRAVIARGSKKICHPRAGGAPFLACPSCFVLLELPKNLTRGTRNGKKILCGACSELLSVKIENNGIVITIPTKLRQISAEDVQNLDDYFKVNECDNSTVNSQSPNVESNALSRDHSVKSGRSSERRSPVSSSLSFSEDERSPDSVIIVKENSKSADLALKDDPPLGADSSFAYLLSKDDSPPPLPHHPQNIEPDDEFADFVFSRCGMGNRSKRALRQKLVNDVPMVTEKEVVYSDVAASTEVSEEEDQPTLHEESESFFGGFFKKRIKNLLRPSQSAGMSRINVFVNGQPLSNRVVRKAEKLAGPIQPGNYWYDYRAGFWGVMGQPCHGIIPPFIEEFNYSMPRNCGAGNTGVFVNGRELHESDLDLLASRGLPTTRNKFYMIEISGRVVDEYTGEELDDLGKLAPTVEKVKHGFGMRPRATVE